MVVDALSNEYVLKQIYCFWKFVRYFVPFNQNNFKFLIL